ncbi:MULTISPECIES: DegT/DnrJ/EryC1/StrS aminotransferase family protein [unclassified Crossiella]|uniref:DegT/DnrJ/EryC1/StrS family aminotransferase n=1 Tax=unclassified Crossiella TaxID=2620835 RepID=UPI001FFEF800|nr:MULTISPECIES: DegT/DnrJ/EryC1/StrS family aminotransferase [unclassified Crossiella]MCK2241784.1 DegT/DnrJ/EryC1/StrS family aminotransferase [Crossiella sp. S99.2]MCK2255344.1 DegT/DnrJ/EryC1/StrS family aminotransferase [Crossiella sp. S99.1]
MSYRYPVSMPTLAGRELEYVTAGIQQGWISSLGPHVRKFEEAFANYNQMSHGVACSSGTAALTLAMRAIGVGPGDEVIVPEFTMIASAWSVTYTGATPVFVDCGDDLNIDVSKIEEKITPRTKAIMPVHIYGRRCDMDPIMELAHEYNLKVVEDSAESHGVRPVAHIAAFSLYANKIITSGEGGVCVTNDPVLDAQMRHLRGMAFSPDHSFLHRKLGYNFRMTDMQAAVALAQTEQLDEFLAARKEIERRYDEGLADIKGITVMPPRDVLWMYDVLAEDREALRAHLKTEGIETRRFFKPMSQQPGYFDASWTSLNAARFAASGFYLPTYVGLTAEDQEYIVAKVRDFYRGR